MCIRDRYSIAFGIDGSVTHVVYNVSNYIEILFAVEILLNFFTSYTNKETFETEYSLKLIA